MAENNLFRTEQVSGIEVVYITIEKILEENTIERLGMELNGIIEEQEGSTLLLNFKEVAYLSSSIIGKLVGLHKRAQKQRCDLALCDINPQIYRIFELTKLDKVFKIFDTERTAVAALGG